MASAHQTNDPSELPKRYSASGPFGFVEGVRQALKIAGRDYHLTMQVPHDLTAGSGADLSGPDAAAFGAVTGPDSGLAHAPKAAGVVRPAIVWDVEMYPARRRKSTGAGAGGSGRMRDPVDMGVSTQPLPVGVSNRDDAQDTENSGRRRVLEPGRDPLWESVADVPDLFRDQIVKTVDGVTAIDPDVVIDLNGYVWDVFVHFVVVGPQEAEVLRMALDLNDILLTAFHRSKMNTEISGWPYQFRTGAWGQVSGKLPPWMAAATVTWQLRQSVVYGAPVSYVDQIEVDVHGK